METSPSSSGLVNIGGDKNDSSYRYKMPPIQTKIEGRGNGIRTVVTNMRDVASALGTNPAYTTKFFGIELGALSKYDEKSGYGTVNGAHDNHVLVAALEIFIKDFVLCPTCGLPETRMKVKKTDIFVDCQACGHHGHLLTQHKLTTYVVKNPPNPKQSKAQMSKKDQRRLKNKTAESGEGPSDTPADDASATPEAEPSVGEAPMLNGPPSTADMKSAILESEDPEDTSWSMDTSKEAKKARKVEMFGGEAGPDAPAPKSLQEALGPLAAPGTGGNAAAALAKIAPWYANGSPSNDEILAKIKRESTAESLSAPQRVMLAWELLFDDSFISAKQLKARTSILTPLVGDKSPAMKQLLGCWEAFSGLLHPSLVKYTQVVLMELYDADLAGESEIRDWFEHPTEGFDTTAAQLVRKHAGPFIKWLDEAEEEDD